MWCNDRSIYQLGGWDPDGGATRSTYQLYFGGYGRAYKTYTPELTCPRDIDKFTEDAKNGNGALDYPVGLLTADEIMIAGGIYGTGNSSNYLYTGNYYWSGSPMYFSGYYAVVSYVSGYGRMDYINVDTKRSVRPSLSLKPGFTITDGGEGTVEKPYVVG